MASKFGSLFVDLIARTAGFETDMGRAARIAEQRSKQIERSIKGGFNAALGSVTAFATGLVAGFVSVNAAIDAFFATVNKADALDELSQRLGIQVEQLSEWEYAAKLSGTSLESLTTGITRFSKVVAAAASGDSRQANLFKALGIQAKDAQGNLRDVEELLPEVADAFTKLESDTTKTAIALELFGRGGAEMLEFLSRGSEGIDKLGDEARELGGVIDSETAAAAAQFNDNLDRLKLATQGLATEIASNLLPYLDDLVQDLTDYVREGDNAERISTSIASGIRAIGEALEFVGGLVGVLGRVREGLAGIEQQGRATLQGLSGAVLFDPQMQADALANYQEGSRRIQAAIDGDIKKRGQQVEAAKRVTTELARVSVVGDPAALAKAEAERRKQAQAFEQQVNAFLGNPTGKTAKSKGEKSEAEKEAERLQQAYESLAERQREQIALFGETGEAARVRYETEFGELAKLDPALKAVVISQAEQLDNMRLMEDLHEAAAKAVEKETEAYQRQQESTAEFIEDLQFELALYGMTNKERERAIALRYANVDAMSAEGQKISELTEELRLAAEQEQNWNQFKGTLSDAFVDLALDAGNAMDAIRNFFDSIAEQITRSIADGWADKIGDLLKGGGSGSNSSSGGNWFGNILGALWGGGKASGGMALPGMMYEVNERGFEMASVGGRDYMMVGSQPVEITPNHQLGGGGGGTFNFQFAAPTSLKTQKQVANKVSYEQRRARGYA